MTPRYYWALDNCDRCATVPSDELALTTMAIGHDLLAFQPPEDGLVQGARSEIPVEERSRRLRTQCGRAYSRACRGIVGLGLLLERVKRIKNSHLSQQRPAIQAANAAAAPSVV